jgi:predicted nucleotidyltransferase component of viral defense system
VPLTDFQASLARLLSENRTFDSYLAGGAAILIEPNTTRFSHDLDFFHDSEERVAEAYVADRKLLDTKGYSLRELVRGFERFAARHYSSSRTSRPFRRTRFL